MPRDGNCRNRQRQMIGCWSEMIESLDRRLREVRRPKALKPLWPQTNKFSSASKTHWSLSNASLGGEARCYWWYCIQLARGVGGRRATHWKLLLTSGGCTRRSSPHYFLGFLFPKTCRTPIPPTLFRVGWGRRPSLSGSDLSTLPWFGIPIECYIAVSIV